MPGRFKPIDLCTLAALPFGFVLFPASGYDDRFITLWSARSLALSGQILNYNGDRIEQSSSLGFTLALAALHRLTGADLLLLATVLAAIGGLLLVLAAGHLARRLHPGSESAVRLTTAFSLPVLFWSFSAMEGTLAAAAMLAFVACSLRLIDAGRGLATAGVMMLAWQLLRPEAAAVGLASLAVMALLRPRLWRPLLRLAAVTLLVALALALARQCYFGQPLPQPVYGKSGAFLHVAKGLEYLVRPAQLLAGVPLCLALAAWRARQAPVVAAFTLVTLLFAVAVGGDWMNPARLVIPAVPASLALLFARSIRPPLIVTLVVAEIGAALVFARSFPNVVPVGSEAVWPTELAAAAAPCSWLERHNRTSLRDLQLVKPLEEVVQRCRGLPIVQSGQAGMLVYELARTSPGRFRFIDDEGLTTRPPTEDVVADVVFGFERPPAGFRVVQSEPEAPRLRYDWLGLGALSPFGDQRIAVREDGACANAETR